MKRDDYQRGKLDADGVPLPSCAIVRVRSAVRNVPETKRRPTMKDLLAIARSSISNLLMLAEWLFCSSTKRTTVQRVCLACGNLTMDDEKLDMRLYEEEGFESRRDRWIYSRVLTKLNECRKFSLGGHIEGGLLRTIHSPEHRILKFVGDGIGAKTQAREKVQPSSYITRTQGPCENHRVACLIQGVTFGYARGGRSILWNHSDSGKRLSGTAWIS